MILLWPAMIEGQIFKKVWLSFKNVIVRRSGESFSSAWFKTSLFIALFVSVKIKAVVLPLLRKSDFEARVYN